MDGYQVYKICTAVKMHFTSDYDYFRYNGKVKVSFDSYNRRNDRYIFEKIAKRVKTVEELEIRLSAFFHEGNSWVGALLEHEEHYMEYARRIRLQPVHEFRSDIGQIAYRYSNPIGTLRSIDNQIPQIMQSGIHPVCICILDILFRNERGYLFDRINERLSESISWNLFYLPLKKLRPFVGKYTPLGVRRDLMKVIVKEWNA